MMINPEEAKGALNDAKAMHDAGDISGASATVEQLARDMGAGLDIVTKINAILRYEGPGHGMTTSVLKEAADEIERLRAELADMKGYYGPIPNRSGPAFDAIEQ